MGADVSTHGAGRSPGPSDARAGWGRRAVRAAVAGVLMAGASLALYGTAYAVAGVEATEDNWVGQLSRARIQCVNRVHRLLSELVPGQSKRDITTGQAKRILATVKPRDVAGKTRRRLAAVQIAARRDITPPAPVRGLICAQVETVRATSRTLAAGASALVAAPVPAATHSDGPARRQSDRERGGPSRPQAATHISR